MPHVVVVSTSYPRDAHDPAGRFVADAVEHIRARGFRVTVVSPATVGHFGLAYGYGMLGNLRARPWLVLLLPLFLLRLRRAVIRAQPDLVHAHWLFAGIVAASIRKPYAVQVWGTDVALARRAPWLVRPVLRRARVAIAASSALADEARALGAREVVVVPWGVRIPERTGEPVEPPQVLFAGRLSAEKGIEEFLAATAGMRRAVVGAGPIAVSESVGMVSDVGPYYADAAVVVVPSRREGYGMVAREAMAHGRPVIVSAVGGLLDAVEDEVDGIVVPPCDAPALRRAVERLLADAELRSRLGAAARAKASRRWRWDVVGDELAGVYRSIT